MLSGSKIVAHYLSPNFRIIQYIGKKERPCTYLRVFKVTPGKGVHDILQQSIICRDEGGLHVHKVHYDSQKGQESLMRSITMIRQ